MTNKDKFIEVVNRNNGKMYETAAKMGMASQTLYNKLNNTTDFTAPEMKRFKDLYPDVTDDEFNSIFFAVDETAQVLE